MLAVALVVSLCFSSYTVHHPMTRTLMDRPFHARLGRWLYIIQSSKTSRRTGICSSEVFSLHILRNILRGRWGFRLVLFWIFLLRGPNCDRFLGISPDRGLCNFTHLVICKGPILWSAFYWFLPTKIAERLQWTSSLKFSRFALTFHHKSPAHTSQRIHTNPQFPIRSPVAFYRKETSHRGLFLAWPLHSRYSLPSNRHCSWR